MHRRHTRRFYSPNAANSIASENRKQFSPPIHADTPKMWHFNLIPRLQVSLLSAILKSHVIKISQPDWLTSLAIRIDECKNIAGTGTLRDLIADICHADRGRICENHNRGTGQTYQFSPIATIAVACEQATK